MGKFVGEEALAAVGTSNPLMTLAILFINGMCLGAGILVSTAFGAGNTQLMERQVSTTAIAGTVFSLAFSALCVILATPLLQLMQVPADILPIAVSYLRNGKTDQERSNGSLCHVVCHGNSMISPYNVFTICRPGRMARAERLAPTWMSCAAACKTAPDATEAGMASVRSTFCAARCASVVFTATTLSTT